MRRRLRIAHVVIVAGLLTGCLGATDVEPAVFPARPEAYLWSKPFPHLVVEIDRAEGIEPSQFAVDALVETLAAVTGKQSVKALPYGTLTQQEAPRAQKKWSDADMRALGKATLDSAEGGYYGRGDTAVLHILYVYGEDAEGATIRGATADATVFIFIEPDEPVLPSAPKRGGPTSNDLFERALLIHEAGHVLGLVNNGLAMQRDHEHADSPSHSRSPESVMYPGIDMLYAQIGTVLPEEAPPHTFDADDMADIRAFQALEP